MIDMHQLHYGEHHGDESASLYSALSINADAEIRRIWFAAKSEVDAKAFCQKSGFACLGLATLRSDEKSTPETLKIFEVMAQLKLSRSSIYRLLSSGELKRLRGVGAVRITRRSLDAYLDSGK